MNPTLKDHLHPFLCRMVMCLGMAMLSPSGFAAGTDSSIESNKALNLCGDDAQTYKVKKGETLKKILNQFYPNSPLKDDWLLMALRTANPQWGQAKKVALRPGDCLHLPNHHGMILETLTTVLTSEELSSWAASVPKPSDLTPGPGWVRYP
jgi:LysM domain